MLKKILFAILVITTVFFYSSCSKYEEGPFFSFATKKGRVTNSWKQTEFNGSPTINDVVWIFESNGNFKVEYNGTPNVNPAKWSFEDSKAVISVYYEQDDVTIEYVIVRLTSNEMWLDQKVGSNFVRIKFEKKK